MTRKTWIQSLPKKVCYKFLYDRSEHIPKKEIDDGISLNSAYQGRAVRFGEKLYKFYSYVQKSDQFRNVKYVIEMDDDVVLCPRQLFEYLNSKNLTSTSYVGWFHKIGNGTKKGKEKVGANYFSDENFVLIGRGLMERVLSKKYCELRNEFKCDVLDQHFDNNYGGISLAKWLSKMDDINVLPMNSFFSHYVQVHNHTVKPSNLLLFHPAKNPKLIIEKYLNCHKVKIETNYHKYPK